MELDPVQFSVRLVSGIGENHFGAGRFPGCADVDLPDEWYCLVELNPSDRRPS